MELVDDRGDIKNIEKIIVDNPEMDINYSDYMRWTVLHLTCLRGNTEVVRLLLNHPNIDVNRETICGRTAFVCACERFRVDVARLLINDHRIDINQSGDHTMPVLFSSAANGRLGIVELLLACYHQDVNFQYRTQHFYNGNYEDQNAREIADYNGHHDIASLLDAYEANPLKIKGELRRRLYPQREVSRVFCLILLIYDGTFEIKS